MVKGVVCGSLCVEASERAFTERTAQLIRFVQKIRGFVTPRRARGVCMAPRRRSSVAAANPEAAMEEYDDLGASFGRDVLIGEIGELSVGLTCQICGEPPKSPTTLPCAHSFCLTCVGGKLQGPGVYESKCPTCGIPVHFKNLRVNQTIAGLAEQVEAAQSRFSNEHDSQSEKPARADERAGEAPASPGNDGQTTPPTPTDERCRQIAKDLIQIDAAMAYLTERLLALERKAAARGEREAATAKTETETETETDALDPNAAPTPTPIRVSAVQHTQHTVNTQNSSGTDNAHTHDEPLATPLASSDTRTHTQVKRLTLAQARRLYAAAHGRQPPKRLSTLKKLRHELSKLDELIVEQLLEMVLAKEAGDGDGEDGGDDVDAGDADDVMDVNTTATGGGDDDGAVATTDRDALEKTLATQSQIRQRVFAHASASSSSSSQKKKQELTKAVTLVNKAVSASEQASSVPPGGEFPENATHLLMDVDDDGNTQKQKTGAKKKVRLRTVRYLEAIACGAWVLDFVYLRACAAAGRWLPECDFELVDHGRDDSWNLGSGEGEGVRCPGNSVERRNVRADTRETCKTETGPVGGRMRKAQKRRLPFVGEVVAVASAPERLLVVEMERLLFAGGAEAVLKRPVEHGLGGRTTIGGSSGRKKRRKTNSIGGPFSDTACEKGVPNETNAIPDTVPDSQQSEYESPESLNNHDWAAGATVVIDGGDAGGDAVGDAVGCPVVDWHWVLHSLVHHTPMPKAQYPSVRSGV